MLSTFYGDVLPPDGHYALWTKSNKQHAWFNSIDALTAATEDLIESEGVYFATAAFNEQAAINGNKDARTQANVVSKKALYLDLDAGEKKLAKHGAEKVYATQRDALLGAAKFFRDTGMTPTYLLSSGEGLHVYWVLDEAVSPSVWKQLATAMSRLFQQYSLKEDPSVTTDSARILRPVGTLHENGKTVSQLGRTGKTYNSAELRETLANLLDDDSLEFEPLEASDERTGINDDALFTSTPKSLMKIVPQCASLKEVIAKRGNVEEPFWRAMLGVVKFTVEGDPAAHKLSSGHPSYDKHDTQRKLDNWKTGPTTCKEFAKHCSKCAICPQFGQIKSPITLGYLNDREVAALPEEKKPEAMKAPAPTGDPWDGFIPQGFRVEKKGRVNTLVWNMPVVAENDDGDTRTSFMSVPFTDTVFWFQRWSESEGTDDKTIVNALRWNGERTRPFSIPVGELNNFHELKSTIGHQGVVLGTHKHAIKAMQEYTNMQYSIVTQTASQPKVSKRLGLFIDDAGELACAQGEFVINAEGGIQRGILTADLRGVAAKFSLPLPASDTGSWDADVWSEHLLPKAKKYADFMRKHYSAPGLEKYQLAAMLQIASPFMAFAEGTYLQGKDLPPNGLTVSLFSAEGGRGKTTLMRAAALAYGPYSATVLDSNAMGSTAIARISRMSLMGTLPVGMDEMGDLSATETAQLVSAVANGSSRDRANKEGGLVIGSKWSLMCSMATNKNQRDMINAAAKESNAIQYRLIELDFDNVVEFDTDAQTAFRNEWSLMADSAGALGAVIHREICSMGVARVNEYMLKAVTRASEMIESKMTDRFQYRGLGAVLALHSVLSRLGLDMFDRDGLIAEFKAAHELGHSYAVENTLPTDGLELLSMALHDLTEFTAVTMEETRRTRHVTKYDEPLVQVPRETRARHIVSTRITYVSSSALRDWCTTHRVSFSKIVNAAKREGVLEDVFASRASKASAYNLLKGMRGSTESAVSCYCFNVALLAGKTGKDQTRGLLPANVVPLVQKTEVPDDEDSGSSSAAAS